MSFSEKIKAKGYKFIYIQKFHKKFDRFVTLKLNETNFLFDGAIFEVFLSVFNREQVKVNLILIFLIFFYFYKKKKIKN